MNDRIDTESLLLEVLTQPSDRLVEFVHRLDGPLVVLGAGGKMGPTLCVRAKRAAQVAGTPLDIIAVSRFSDSSVRTYLMDNGVDTLVCDLFDANSIQHLPESANVIYLVGLKFGTRENPALTWAANTLIPARVCERYADARMVVLSTGNVYPLTPVEQGGSVESDPLTPLGEYANVCVGRERITEYYTQISALQAVLIRLNYAMELRYGILVDLARTIATGEAVDVTMGYFNGIWQGDANDMIIRALALTASPARPLNLTGLNVLSVRETAQKLAERMGREVALVGEEADTALLSNSVEAYDYLGAPQVSMDDMIAWTAEWVQRGGRTYDKRTHFQVRDGGF